jgi:hypothetical protein
MASDVMSLFNMPTQEQLGRSYLEGMLMSPAQMGNQGLLQQVVSLGGNAGAGLGYGVGRLMGGMTADQVRAKGIEDAMQAVQGMGLTSDAEMYGALSQELASRGLTQDALLARNTGLKARQVEEGMRIDKERLAIAQAAEARAQEEAPLRLKELNASIAQKEDALKTDQQRLAEVVARIKTLDPQKDSAKYQEEYGKWEGIKQRINEHQQKLEDDKARLRFEERRVRSDETRAEAAMRQAQAQEARAAADAKRLAENEKFTIPVYGPSIIPGTKGDIIGRQSKAGQILGNDGLIYNSVAELMSSMATQKPSAAAGGKPPQTPDESLGILSTIRNMFSRGDTNQPSAAQSPTTDLPTSVRPEVRERWAQADKVAAEKAAIEQQADNDPDILAIRRKISTEPDARIVNKLRAQIIALKKERYGL